MPALFIGHGNPMNAIRPEGTSFRCWRGLGERIGKPEAVLCISAHWETHDEVRVTTGEHPETIYDFFGFPPELYQVRYRPQGDPALAARTLLRLARSPHVSAAGAAAKAGASQLRTDAARGLDHGVWGVLVAMYPQADVPVVQLSLDMRRPPAFHYALGRQLASLRDEGVLVLGSGNIVHNLRHFNLRDTAPLPWAVDVDREARRRLLAGDHAGLIDYETLGPHARDAVPTLEHYLPLLYVLGAQREGERIELHNDEVVCAISMTCALVGEA